MPSIPLEDISTKLSANHKPYETQCKHRKGFESLYVLGGYQIENIAQKYSDNDATHNLGDVELLRKTRAKCSAQDNQAK